MLKEFVDVVPILVPARGGGIQAVRAVLTSSEEDKNLLEVLRNSFFLNMIFMIVL